VHESAIALAARLLVSAQEPLFSSLSPGNPQGLISLLG
jgi:hypothetical protein